jgi:recombination protein RecT
MTSTDVARRPDLQVAQHEADFAAVLPSHVKPSTFTRLAVGALRRDPALYQAASRNPESLLYSLLEAARLGLEPGTDEFYLTPRGGKDAGILGIVGYQGEIELIYRAGAVVSVKAEVVYEHDRFEFRPDMDRPLHTVDWFRPRGDVLGAYAYAEMVGGGVSKVVIIGPDEIERAKSASATARSDRSPWKTDYAAMVLKTAIHRLAKWVPTSAEYRREQLRAASEVARETFAAPVAEVVHVTPEPAQEVTTDAPGVLVDEDGVMYEIEDVPES